MSASLYYQPVEGKYLLCNSPSRIIDILNKAFGELPITIGESDLREAIRGISFANDDPVWKELENAILAHGKIRIWAEY
jgi:hypothetical protein